MAAYRDDELQTLGDILARMKPLPDPPAGASDAVTILVSSGHPLLDDAALAAVRGWRFNPATRGGAAVAAPVDVPIRFRLQD